MTNVSTIGTATRDYADIDLWEADVQGTLTDIEEGRCYDDSDFTGNYVIAGSTTTTSFFMRLTTASGEKHIGTRGTGVTLVPAGGHALHIQDNFTEVIGLEITNSSAGDSDEGIRPEADDIFIDSCFFYDIDDVANNSDGIYVGNWDINNLVVQNCIIINCARAGVHLQAFNAGTARTQVLKLINCTIINCGWGIGLQANNAGSDNDVTAYNTLLVENTEDWGLPSPTGNNGSQTMSGNYNIYDTDPDTLVPGGNSINLAASRVSDDLADFTSGDWVFFDNLTASSEDLHIQGSSTQNAAIQGGVGPSTQALVPTTDIDGDTRAGTIADVGADETIGVFLEILAETVNVSEGIVRLTGLKRVQNETVNKSEGNLRLSLLIRLLAETVHLSEVLLKVSVFVRVKNEILNISEGILKKTVSFVNETLNVSEGKLSILGLIRFINESPNLSEDLVRLTGLKRVLVEIINFSEGILNPVTYKRVIDENINFSEGILRLIAYTRLVGESLNSSEIAFRLREYILIIDDTLNLTEAIGRFLGYIRLINESLNATETVLKLIGYVRVRIETLNSTEVSIPIIGRVRLIVENLNFSEAIIKRMGYVRVLTDTFNLSEGILRNISITRIINSTVQISDATLKVRSMGRIVNETLQMNEGILTPAILKFMGIIKGVIIKTLVKGVKLND